MRHENTTIQRSDPETRLRKKGDVEGCAVAKESAGLGLALLPVTHGKAKFGWPRFGTLDKDQAILCDFEEAHIALVDHKEHQRDEEMKRPANDEANTGNLLDDGDRGPARGREKNGVIIEGLDSLVGDEDEMLHRIVEPCRSGNFFHKL